ncbi:hypothetical protein [Komagataeibacter xylinus]|uniref:hypothetical protein n=1 Tax=Komagataeibacter xylinus TaxID=28448 RepID=UPI00102F4676|nr:hypothetical protein [Komagataeibacter xylinus]
MDHNANPLENLGISPDLLGKVDTSLIIRDFLEDFKKLGSFKETREKHESQNAFMRLWNSDDIEKAQLDSIELQERFAKKQGQLIVLSVAMSHQLNMQQKTIEDQQTSLYEKTRELASTNETISTQQHELSSQQEQLRQLVDQYFALKGLTADQAKQLVLIANDVKTAREQMTSSFESERHAVMNVKADLETMLSRQQQDFRALAEEQRFETSQALNEINKVVFSEREFTRCALEEATAASTERVASLREQTNKSFDTLRTQLNLQADSYQKMCEELECKISSQIEDCLGRINIQIIQTKEHFQEILSTQTETVDELEKALQKNIVDIEGSIQKLRSKIFILTWMIVGSIGGAVAILLWMILIH